jgi:hypothetical protein
MPTNSSGVVGERYRDIRQSAPSRDRRSSHEVRHPCPVLAVVAVGLVIVESLHRLLSPYSARYATADSEKVGIELVARKPSVRTGSQFNRMAIAIDANARLTTNASQSTVIQCGTRCSPFEPSRGGSPMMSIFAQLLYPGPLRSKSLFPLSWPPVTRVNHSGADPSSYGNKYQKRSQDVAPQPLILQLFPILNIADGPAVFQWLPC